MVTAMVMVLAGRARADDAAGVSVDGFVVDGVIFDGVVISGERVVPHALVRVVGERVVVITRADGRGHFHVGGLPAGAYRVELERGVVAEREPAHAPNRLDVTDASRPLCFIRMGEVRFKSAIGAARAPEERPFIDTSSTALVTVFDGH